MSLFDIFGSGGDPEETNFYEEPTPDGTQGWGALGEKTVETANSYAPGYAGANVGPENDNPSLFNAAAVRADQSGYERLMEQRGNHFYGGTATGTQDAAAAARTNVGQYTNQLGGYGDAFATEMGAAGDRAAPIDQYGLGMANLGTQGIYGTADALTGYAQQGPGASVAQAQHDMNTAQAMRQQLALAGSGRGAGGGASAFRQAGMNQAQIQGGANAQTAMLQAQEADDWRQRQLQAYGQAGQLYGAGSDSALAGANYYTGAQQAQTQLNDQYALGMGGLATQAATNAGNMQLGVEQGVHDINMGGLEGSMGYEQLMNQLYGIDKGVFVDMAGINSGENMAREGGMWNAFGGLLEGVSDIRAKTNIAPTSALDAIEDAGGYSYNYLDPARHGEGRYVGPMAQELESAPGVVYEQQDGTKAIDPGRLTMLNTSALAELNRKVDALEGSAPTKTKSKSQSKPKYDVQIGEAQIDEPRYDVEIGQAQYDPWSVQIGEAQIEPPPMSARQGITGPTQPIVYSGDPARLEFEEQKYGTPAFGAPAPDSPAAEEETGSFLDRWLGSSIGQQAADIAHETRANEELRQRFRQAPREDVYL